MAIDCQDQLRKMVEEILRLREENLKLITQLETRQKQVAQAFDDAFNRPEKCAPIPERRY